MYCFGLQTSIHALAFIVHHLESVRLTVLMKLVVYVTRTVLHIRTLFVQLMVQRMTTNAGTS